ncbi:MAG: ATP-binding protein [Gammaproteobacteria bacterium]|nr:ATP-binding protein [Gammaproteobacteria bacterium]
MSDTPASLEIESADDMQFYLDLMDTGRWDYSVEKCSFSVDPRAAGYLIGDKLCPGFTVEHFLEMVHPEDKAAVSQHFADPAQNSLRLNFRVTDGNSHWRTLTIKGQWHLDPVDGNRTSARGVVNCEEVPSDDLRPSESELIRMVVDAIPYPVMYITADGHVDFANKTFRRATRSTTEQTNGQPVSEVLSDKERDNGTRAFLECMKGRHVSREGESAVEGMPTRYCKYVYEPVRNKSGKVLGVCSTVVDLTDIKEAEEALLASHHELERSNRDLEQFAYVASHDLKAPLRAIDVLVGWLSDDLAEFTEGDVHENINLLKQRTKRLNRLLDDLLAYSRAGKQVGEQSIVDCNVLVEDICTLLDVPENFQVNADIDLGELTLYAAPLEQVLRNLISNAIKHHPGPSGHISVTAELKNDHCLFSVTDDGAGIPEEYSKRVFEMFQTLKPRDELEGSGMGLAIVSRIIECQDGRIWFEPAPDGTGTAFKFEWKLSETDEQQPSRKNAA